MRVLFTAVPIHGHLLPLMPLAEAAVAAGDAAAVAAPPALAHLAGDVPVLPAGPDIATLLAENDRRTGGADMADPSDIFPVASLFAGTRVDLTFDETLARARDFAADAVVADEYDTIGPMLAAALRLPLVRHAIGLPVSPPPLAPAMEALLAPRYTRRGLQPVDRVALVDPWPPALQEPGWKPAPDRLPIRPRTYAGSVPADLPPARGPRVLVTLGTVLLDGDLLDALVDSVASLGGVDVLAAVPPGVDRTLADSRPNVHFVGFVPMAQLLATGVAVVVAAGGAGTVLAALGEGIPMVLWPKGAEKPMNAERVAAAGAGVVVDDPAGTADAVRTVLGDPRYRAGAARIAAEIGGAPEASEVWADLRDRLRW
ncbi:glycosyltransferase [Dactylosporangium sp. AC04546]|uniref:nucleotide disphospho-sugar-binding domain-containing protein n=1 Tax=Dactylosporangium sp. AC04546 TaxID=2862460 RepID=UPI001EDE7786|nr:nucleotide disphospho-sugar-binding domain-containing protein [Dactylosporangium sp. AC04546]WVK88403.1 glycosyltransferase [Dactylosporangium sp. AC04546]